jgi:dihydroxyacetone synthase
MGAAAIGVALFRDIMRFNPKDPLWLNRDRFILSAGHACLFQYINMMLVGYEAWTLDEVKRYHSRDFKTSKAAGHPEIEQEIGIEVTTGPLVSVTRAQIRFTFRTDSGHREHRVKESRMQSDLLSRTSSSRHGTTRSDTRSSTTQFGASPEMAAFKRE